MEGLGLLFYRTAFHGGPNAIGISSTLAMVIFVLIFWIAIAVGRILRHREVSA